MKMSTEVICNVEGIEEFQLAMQRLDSGLQNQVYRLLVSWAADVKAEAMRNAPVRTGYLRSTINGHVRDWVAEIGADAAYSYFVEFGTKYMAAQPFLWPAIQKFLPALEQLVKNATNAAKMEAGL